LPPEFARSKSVDGVFFVDLPGVDQKDAIGAIHLRPYGLDAKQARPMTSLGTAPRPGRAVG